MTPGVSFVPILTYCTLCGSAWKISLASSSFVPFFEREHHICHRKVSNKSCLQSFRLFSLDTKRAAFGSFSIGAMAFIWSVWGARENLHKESSCCRPVGTNPFSSRTPERLALVPRLCAARVLIHLFIAVERDARPSIYA